MNESNDNGKKGAADPVVPATAAPLNKKPTATLTRAAVGIPDGETLIRKVRGAEGTHDWLGYVKLGRLYTVKRDKAIELVGGGEFEPALTDDATEIMAAVETAAKAIK
jgi:hypothetical protein